MSESDTKQAGPEREYRDRLAQGRFELQRCTSCGKHVFYPRVLCPHCGRGGLHWVPASGRGTVYSTTVVRRKPAGGGGLSCMYPGMYGIFLIVEAVRQLRGEAGARQVRGAKVVLAHGNGGVLSSQITALFGTGETL